MNLPYATYILKCNDGTFYTGFTTNIENRLRAHQNKEVSYTKDKLPVELVFICYCKTKKTACDFERYLKSGSGIALRNKRLIK